MRTLPLLAVLLAFPLIEIYLFIQVGHVIGALPTILLVIGTSMLGAYLLKQQGLSALTRFQNNLRQGQLPTNELREGAFILLGGILLMIPGFFSDFVGLFFLLPPTRRLLLRLMDGRFKGKTNIQGDVFIHSNTRVQEPSPTHSSSQILEGDYIRKDEP